MKACPGAPGEWVFNVRFLAVSPAQVTKNIDIGRPECLSASLSLFLFGQIIGAKFLHGNPVGFQRLPNQLAVYVAACKVCSR
jgi:hypothetical protein